MASEEFGQGRSTLLILNTLATKQLETLYNKKQNGLNPLLNKKRKMHMKLYVLNFQALNPLSIYFMLLI